MNEARLQELWSRFLSGEPLAPEEETELWQALAADPKLRAEFLNDAEDHGMLRALGRSVKDGEAFDRDLGSRIEAESNATRFVNRVESGLAREGPPSEDTPRTLARLSGGHPRPLRPSTRRTRASLDPQGAWMGPAVAAAGILLAVALIFTFSSSEPELRRSDRTAKAVNSREVKSTEARRQAERDDRAREAARADAERKRRDAETRLFEVERKERELAAPPAAELAKDPAAEERRKKSLEEIEREKDRIERELREAAELASRSERPTSAQSPQGGKSPPTADVPASAQGTTQVAFAQVEEVAGEAFRLTKQGRAPLASGSSILADDGVATGGGASRAVLRFPDKTSVELGSDTVLVDCRGDSGKRMTLSQGILRAVVAKQRPGEPMIVTTPHGAVKVVGTTLRIIVDLDPKKGTRLEVEEGKVELLDLAKKSVLVENGYYAVAAEGTELVAKVLPIDEILLSARQARLVGGEWKVIKEAIGGSASALHSKETSYKIRRGSGGATFYDSVKTQPSFILFSFQAEGGKDYKLWIRGKSLLDPGHWATAEIAVELPDAQLTPLSGSTIFAADHAAEYNGFFRAKGYNWIGGSEEHPEGLKPGDIPLTVRFSRTGLQTLKVHVMQAPAWIDAIWFSTTQITRPDAAVTGPSDR